MIHALSSHFGAAGARCGSLYWLHEVPRMTKRLDQAFAEASKLTEIEQDALARWLLEELASERRWETAFAGTHDRVAEMADEALEEHRKGRAREFSPDEL